MFQFPGNEYPPPNIKNSQSSPHEGPHKQEQHKTPPSTYRHLVGTQKKILIQLLNNKRELEELIAMLNDTIATHPHRRGITESISLIVSHLGAISAQLNLRVRN